MIPVEMLKKINLFEGLTDKELKLFQPFTESAEYNEREIVYQKGQPAQNIFMLLSGKALLEERISEDISISLSSMKPGYSFGWYALVPNGSYSYTAVCAEPSKILIMPSEKIRGLLQNTPSLCYKVMLKVFEILKYRIDHRTAQFVSLLSRHPDMEQILDNQPASGHSSLSIECLYG